ncbi:hypothetical protein [Cetobacterium sp.]|uniref:hypothetical protein n=1 Tax=Cetobacterium sp. TaxID=2071632 RepID=UPI002FC72897
MNKYEEKEHLKNIRNGYLEAYKINSLESTKYLLLSSGGAIALLLGISENNKIVVNDKLVTILIALFFLLGSLLMISMLIAKYYSKSCFIKFSEIEECTKEQHDKIVENWLKKLLDIIEKINIFIMLIIFLVIIFMLVKAFNFFEKPKIDTIILIYTR